MQTLPDGPLAPVEAVRPEHAADFLRLQALWSKGQRFGLLLAAVDNPELAAALRQRLDALRPGPWLTVDKDASPVDVLKSLEAANADGCKPAHMVFELDAPRSPDWWQHANVLRERWAEAWQGPLLLWLSSTDLDLLAHQAPDLWNWRDGVFEFRQEGLTSNHLAYVTNEAGYLFSRGATSTSLERRLSELDRLRVELDEGDVSASHVDLERAQLLVVLGRWTEAKSLALSAMNAYLEQDRPSGAGHAKLLLADLMHREGSVEEALKLLTEDVMPLFVSLGDTHTVALAQDQVADILRTQGLVDDALTLYAKAFKSLLLLGDLRSAAIIQTKASDILHSLGSFDDALRLREFEALPLFREIGDTRSVALTLDGIADIYYSKGLLDQSLQTRLEDVLPTLQSLGDKREIAIAMGKIANILVDKRNFDAAIKMHEEQIPILKDLGDVREVLVAQTNLAISLGMRGKSEDLEVVERLLIEAYVSAAQMRLPEAKAIETAFQKIFGRPLKPGS